jgi:competence protein ComEC
LLVLSLAFILGLLLGPRLELAWTWIAGAGFACLLAGIFNRRLARFLPFLAVFRRISPVSLGLLFAALLFGAVRGLAAVPRFTEADLAWYNDGGAVEIEGVVVRPPEWRESSTLLRVRAARLTTLEGEHAGVDHAVTGLLEVNAFAGADYHYGDRLLLFGKLQTPSENDSFSYKDYLARQGVYSTLWASGSHLVERGQGSPILAAVYTVREAAHRFLKECVLQPEAALLSGIVLGIESDIPDKVDRAFRLTGTSHIIAISGANIAVICALLLLLFARFIPRLWAPLPAVLAVAVYTVLVGGEASVVRAAIMGSIGLVGLTIGRHQAGANTLAFSAALMAGFNPGVLGDVGFQLSFAATLGLILFAGPMQEWFAGVLTARFSEEAAHKFSGPASEYLLYSLAAQGMTLPLLLHHFGAVSLSSLLANPLILPAQPAVMVLGGLAVLAGLILRPLGLLLAFAAWPVTAYTIRVVELLARIPNGSVGLLDFNPVWVAGAYALIFGLTVFRRPLAALLQRIQPGEMIARGKDLLASPWLLVPLALAAAFVWRTAFSLPDGRLHVTAVNAAGDMSVLVQTPNGQTMLVNGSAGPNALTSALGRRLPPLNPRLDGLFLTTQASGVLQGVRQSLERLPADQVFWTEADRGRSGDALQQDFIEEDVPLWTLKPGEPVLLDHGITLEVLAQQDESAALLLECGRLRVLIPGGVPPGSLTGQAKQRAYNAGLVILSAGEDAAAWQRLRAQVVVGPAEEGCTGVCLLPAEWLALTSDGEQAWVEYGE